MLSEKTEYTINRAVELAKQDGVTFVVLALKPDTMETALISSVSEETAKNALRMFVQLQESAALGEN